jgi:hypothetical protein
MEEDHDFSEFEDIKTSYRRALLPWWLWIMLLLYNAYNLLYLLGDAYSFSQGYVFAFDVIRINAIIPYPYFPWVSIALCLGMAISFILLWLEKKNAAIIALWCYGIMLALCIIILVKGLFAGHFFFRYEMIIFIDIVLRLSTGRKSWVAAGTRHDKASA